MLRTVILAACFCAVACLSSVAEARPGAKHPHHEGRHARVEPGHQAGCSQPEMRPCAGVDQLPILGRGNQRKANKNRHKLASTAIKEITHLNTVLRPARYIAGRLVCAVNVNAELARRGIRGTGSALAKSFLHWGRPSRPVAGAVAVYGRKGGGHVAIVSRVVGGRVYVWNPSSRAHRWREVEYRRRAIAYRVAGQ